MATIKQQAISGVSAGHENLLMTVYPSVSATGIGRFLGLLCDSVPLKINGIKLSALLFGLPAAFLALPVYFAQKLWGSRYELTSRCVRVRKGLSGRLAGETGLGEIADVQAEQRPGQAFFKAADLLLIAGDGSVLARLNAVPRAEVFRQTILEARDARFQVDSALATIQSRQPA